jgi:hypothetical protein
MVYIQAWSIKNYRYIWDVSEFHASRVEADSLPPASSARHASATRTAAPPQPSRWGRREAALFLIPCPTCLPGRCRDDASLVGEERVEALPLPAHRVGPSRPSTGGVLPATTMLSLPTVLLQYTSGRCPRGAERALHAPQPLTLPRPARAKADGDDLPFTGA